MQFLYMMSYFGLFYLIFIYFFHLIVTVVPSVYCLLVTYFQILTYTVLSTAK